MVLHGGPGGASQEVYRQYFDPKAYRVIQIDQRGCGRSTPHAELQENNTQVASPPCIVQWPILIKLCLEFFMHASYTLSMYLFDLDFLFKRRWNSKNIRSYTTDIEQCDRRDHEILPS